MINHTPLMGYKSKNCGIEIYMIFATYLQNEVVFETNPMKTHNFFMVVPNINFGSLVS